MSSLMHKLAHTRNANPSRRITPLQKVLDAYGKPYQAVRVKPGHCYSQAAIAWISRLGRNAGHEVTLIQKADHLWITRDNVIDSAIHMTKRLLSGRHQVHTEVDGIRE